MTWMLKLYPSTWRQRYGAELEQLVAEQPRSLQLFVDLLGGAVDAHWKPQALAQRMESATSSEGGGSNMFTRLKGCCAAERMSRKEAFQGAALTLGATMLQSANLGPFLSKIGNGRVAFLLVDHRSEDLAFVAGLFEAGEALRRLGENG